MASPRVLARIDRLAWVLIYGGLFALVLGIASHDEAVIAGWSLSLLGAVGIWIRSRMSVDAKAKEPPR